MIQPHWPEVRSRRRTGSLECPTGGEITLTGEVWEISGSWDGLSIGKLLAGGFWGLAGKSVFLGLSALFLPLLRLSIIPLRCDIPITSFLFLPIRIPISREDRPSPAKTRSWACCQIVHFSRGGMEKLSQRFRKHVLLAAAFFLECLTACVEGYAVTAKAVA